MRSTLKNIDNFINNRKKFSRYLVDRVAVMQIGGGLANNCVKNAFDNLDLSIGMKIISGWIIGKTIPVDNQCVIHSHFWNVDSNGNYFDTTPLASDYFEYVIDMELAVFAESNHEKLRSLVCFSLIQFESEYIAFDMLQGKDVKEKIADLSNSIIFKFKPAPHLTSPHLTSPNLTSPNLT